MASTRRSWSSRHEWLPVWSATPAKRAAIAHEYLETKRDVQALQATETAQRANRRNELTKSLFGPEKYTTGQNAIFYRDAQDKADSIPGEC
jgi:hypothetical protein